VVRPSIYLDANVFIALLEARGSVTDCLADMLAAVESGEGRAITSELTLAETLVGPIRDGDVARVQAFTDLVTTGSALAVVAVTRDVLIQAAQWRATGRRDTRLPDAIHIATAELMNCSHFVAGDQRLALPGTMQHIDLTIDGLTALRRILSS
jgi:predicted nucleic acid-binding protein